MPIEQQARHNLLRLALAWCDATGRSLSTCAGRCGVDPLFFNDAGKQLAEGPRKSSDRAKSFTVRIYDRTVAWFHNVDNWPLHWVGGDENHDHRNILKKSEGAGKCFCGAKAVRWKQEDIPELDDLIHYKRKR